MTNVLQTFPQVAIGPMVGISHAAFRKLIALYTPPSFMPLVFSEMLSSARVPHENLYKTRELKLYQYPAEPQLVFQLVGNSVSQLVASITKLNELYPWGFDINMGCPAPQIVRHAWGVKLMENPETAFRLIEELKKHTTKPLSVKFRGGINELDVNRLVEFAKGLEQAGANWLIVHPRVQEQKHKGEVSWEVARTIQAAVKIPVFINGNVQTLHDILHCTQKLSIAGVMIARGAIARPWLLWQLAYAQGDTTPPQGFPERHAPPLTPNEEGQEFMQATLRFLALLEEIYPNDEQFILERVRFFVAQAVPWLKFGHAFWKMTTQSHSVPALRQNLQAFLEKYENPMYERAKFL